MLSCLTKRKNKAVFPYPLHEKNALFHSFFHKKHENGPFFIDHPFSRSNRPKEKKSGSTRTFFLKTQRRFLSKIFRKLFFSVLPACPACDPVIQFFYVCGTKPILPAFLFSEIALLPYHKNTNGPTALSASHANLFFPHLVKKP